MGEAFEIIGNIRGTSRPNYPEGNYQKLQLNAAGDLAVAQALPERAELARLGNSWGAQILDANAFTLLITIPTTLADLALQNCESAGGKSYLIDRVWIKCKTSTASAGTVEILAQCVPPGTAAVAHAATSMIYSLSCKPNYGGKAQIAIASTAVGALANKWFPLAIANLSYTTTIAAAGSQECYGRYVIPPGGTFALTAQESVSGGAAIVGVEWHEVQLQLG